MERSISFIHCADLHLDAPFKSMGAYTGDRRNDIKQTFEKIISLSLDKNVDYLLVSGDLFEHDYAGRKTIQWINEQFERLSDKPVIIIPGNHDPCTDDSWYRNYTWCPNVRILSSKNPDFRDDSLSCYFYGIGFDSYRQEAVIITVAPENRPNFFNICLFHGTVDMPFAQQPYNPVNSSQLLKMGFDYYALGHFHKRNEALAKEGIINPGSPEPLGFDEQDKHGVYWVKLTKDNEKLRREYDFIPLQQREYKVIDFDAGGIVDNAQLKQALSEALSRQAKKTDIIRIDLVGRLNDDIYIDINETEQHLMNEYYFLNVKDNTRPNYNLEELAFEKNIIGVFVDIMQEKIGNAQDEEKPLMRKAMYLGLEALLTGNVEI
jgi:exonuclease SbcD